MATDGADSGARGGAPQPGLGSKQPATGRDQFSQAAIPPDAAAPVSGTAVGASALQRRKQTCTSVYIFVHKSTVALAILQD